MASLEEKILGERRENYCSSSEESDHADSDIEENEEATGGSTAQSEVAAASLAPAKEWNGTASNTGPKGVLKDWQEFKAYESAARQEREVSRKAQLEKLTLTCQSSCEEEAKRKQEEERRKEEEELRELEEEEDEFLLEYRKERMKEMCRRLNGGEKKTFGSLIHITSTDQFLTSIDSEPASITIVVHLSSPSLPACRSLNASLTELAADWPNTKFTSVPLALVAEHLSSRFKACALPCFLIYKGGGDCVGSFLSLREEFGDVVYSDEVERFLLDHSVLSAGS